MATTNQRLLCSAISFALGVISTPVFAHESPCSKIVTSGFEASIELSPPSSLKTEEFVRDEIANLKDAERESTAMLDSMARTPEQTAAEVREWAARIKRRQDAGEKLSVLEHTSISYLLRSRFMKIFADESWRPQLEDVLKKSWSNLTGLEVEDNDHLEPLPISVLMGTSRETRLLHFASFEPDVPNLGIQYPVPFATYVPEKGDAVKAAGAMGLVALAFASSGGDKLAWFVTGYYIGSTVEHVLHRFVGHAAPELIAVLKKYGWVRTARTVERVRYGHAYIHHARTFRRHTTQFASEAERERLNAEIDANPDLSPKSKSAIKFSTRHGLTLDAAGEAAIVITTAPILWTISQVVGLDAYATAALMSPMILQVLTPVVLHDVTHVPESQIWQKLDKFRAWLATTRVAELISRIHFLHHRGGGGNYNLMPGADWILGKFRRPNLKQVFRMRDEEVIGSIWSEPK